MWHSEKEKGKFAKNLKGSGRTVYEDNGKPCTVVFSFNATQTKYKSKNW